MTFFFGLVISFFLILRFYVFFFVFPPTQRQSKEESEIWEIVRLEKSTARFLDMRLS
jgi:hypothetical protein